MRFFWMARARIIYKVKNGCHDLYLRLRQGSRKSPARLPAQALRIALQINKKTTAPIVAVIKLPQKSGMTSR